MQPVSREALVTAALKSELARAQKNNCKQLVNKSPRKFVKRCSLTSGGGDFGVAENTVLAAVKKSKALKLQSEFDLWIERAQEFSFKSEGYTNGAPVPEDIECLNSYKRLVRKGSGGSTKVKSQNSVLQLKGLLPKKNKGTVAVEKQNLISLCSSSKEKQGATTEKKVTITNGEVNGTTVLKGKNKLRPSGTGEELSENSFEKFTKFNEGRKLTKKLIKLRNRLLKQGLPKEDAEKLIEQAKVGGGGVGAITQKLRQLLLKKRKKEHALQVAEEKKKIKMKDLSSSENGESAVSRPETPVASTSTGTSFASPRMMNGGCNSSSSGNQHQLPQSKRVLYPREKIIPGYTEKLPVGAGFYNMGNSCYLNASLQAVFHVPAFINWLKSDVEHRKHCQDSTNCIVCAMKKTFDSAICRGNTPTAIRPVEIINRLRSICRHFSHGRQEDAHEFLRYLFESMERSYLTAIGALRIDDRSKETNPLGQIFGGYVRTEVTCLKCHYVSTTFQPTAELQLDIRHVTTLEDAILNHFKKERLDNNDYKCEKCRTISQATKQFSLEIPPIVLCLQLKRFTLYGTKIAKRIHCNKILDMSKYMHKSKQVNGFSNLRYRLVALVTYLGSSPNCGHYTAIAEASNGHFYQFDDSFVNQVTDGNALNNDAYVIIYEMDKRCKKSPEASQGSSSSNSSGYSSNLSYPSSTITSSQSQSSSSSSSPMSSIFQTKKLQPSGPIPKLSSASSSSTCSSLQSSKLVHSSAKQESSEAKISTNGSSALESTSSPAKAGFKGPGLERKMISFGIRTGPKKITILKPGAALTNSSKLSQGTSSSSSSSSSNSNGTSNGSSSRNNGDTSWSSPSGSSRPDNHHKSDQTIKLVPYNDDDESDKDENGRNGTEASLSNDSSKRLKSPNIFRKQSPATPMTPPKSPKPVSPSSTTTPPSGPRLSSPPTASQEISSLCKKERTPTPPSSQKTDTTSVSSNSSKLSASENSSNIAAQRDGVKRKAPADDETTPRKSRPDRKRHSSSSSSGSSSSRSTSSTSETVRSNNSKRKRDDEVTPTKSPLEKKPLTTPSSYHHQSTSLSSEHSNGVSGNAARRDRESQSQERDRERRRDRNPSRSRSPSMDSRDKRGSSIDRRREHVNGGTFDVSKLRLENTIVGWDGQKSLLSKSMDEDHRKLNMKSMDEEYDDEFDEGRIKKVRRSRSLPRDSETSSGNKFQSIEDRKKEVQQWSTLLDGYGPGFRRNSGGSGSWSNGGGGGDDSSRDKQRFLPRPGSSNGNGPRPRHSSSNGNGSSHSNSNNYSRNSHGRSPYRKNHHNGGGGPNHHHRSQSHGSYHNNSNGNKHWSNDRNPNRY